MNSKFICPRCGRVSYNPTDATQRYCGFCHSFLDDAVPQSYSSIVQIKVWVARRVGDQYIVSEKEFPYDTWMVTRREARGRMLEALATVAVGEVQRRRVYE